MGIVPHRRGSPVASFRDADLLRAEKQYHQRAGARTPGDLDPPHGFVTMTNVPADFHGTFTFSGGPGAVLRATQQPLPAQEQIDFHRALNSLTLVFHHRNGAGPLRHILRAGAGLRNSAFPAVKPELPC